MVLEGGRGEGGGEVGEVGEILQIFGSYIF